MDVLMLNEYTFRNGTTPKYFFSSIWIKYMSIEYNSKNIASLQAWRRYHFAKGHYPMFLASKLLERSDKMCDHMFIDYSFGVQYRNGTTLIFNFLQFT